MRNVPDALINFYFGQGAWDKVSFFVIGCVNCRSHSCFCFQLFFGDEEDAMAAKEVATSPASPGINAGLPAESTPPSPPLTPPPTRGRRLPPKRKHAFGRRTGLSSLVMFLRRWAIQRNSTPPPPPPPQHHGRVDRRNYSFSRSRVGENGHPPGDSPSEPGITNTP